MPFHKAPHVRVPRLPLGQQLLDTCPVSELVELRCALVPATPDTDAALRVAPSVGTQQGAHLSQCARGDSAHIIGSGDEKRAARVPADGVDTATVLFQRLADVEATEECRTAGQP